MKRLPMNPREDADTASKEYQRGKNAAKESRANGHIAILLNHPNPYKYGTLEWERWNLGWNYEIKENG